MTSCPHCGHVPAEYPDGSVIDDFYKLPVKAEKVEGTRFDKTLSRADVLCCPACRKVFMGEEE